MIKTKTDREAAQRWEADGPSTSWGELFQKGWQAFINTGETWRCLQTYRRTHRQRDSDTEPWWRSASSLSRDRKWKRRPMATRPKSSSLIRWWAARALLPCLLLITPFYISFFNRRFKIICIACGRAPPCLPARLAAPARPRAAEGFWQHLSPFGRKQNMSLLWWFPLRQCAQRRLGASYHSVQTRCSFLYRTV